MLIVQADGKLMQALTSIKSVVTYDDALRHTGWMTKSAGKIKL